MKANKARWPFSICALRQHHKNHCKDAIDQSRCLTVSRPSWFTRINGAQHDAPNLLYILQHGVLFSRHRTPNVMRWLAGAGRTNSARIVYRESFTQKDARVLFFLS